MGGPVCGLGGPAQELDGPVRDLGGPVKGQGGQVRGLGSGPGCFLIFFLLLSVSSLVHFQFFEPFQSSRSPPPCLPPSVPLCLCFTSYRVVPLLVSILFAACESIGRNKNFTNPINYAHFIFITRLHRPHRSDNRLMIQPASRDAGLPPSPFILTPPAPLPSSPLYLLH